MGILGAQRRHHRPPAGLAFTRMGKKQADLSRLPSRPADGNSPSIGTCSSRQGRRRRAPGAPGWGRSRLISPGCRRGLLTATALPLGPAAHARVAVAAPPAPQRAQLHASITACPASGAGRGLGGQECQCHQVMPDAAVQVRTRRPSRHTCMTRGRRLCSQDAAQICRSSPDTRRCSRCTPRLLASHPCSSYPQMGGRMRWTALRRAWRYRQLTGGPREVRPVRPRLSRPSRPLNAPTRRRHRRRAAS